MTTESYIDSKQFLSCVQIRNKTALRSYLKNIFVELKEGEAINKHSYHEYLKVPMFISDKIFSIFDKDKDGFLSEDEFVEGLLTLNTGDMEEIAKLIFDFLDFDKDGVVEYEDVRLLFFLWWRNHESQIEKLLLKFFDKDLEECATGIDYQEFCDMSINKFPEILIISYFSLLKCMSFSNTSIEYISKCKNLMDNASKEVYELLNFKENVKKLVILNESKNTEKFLKIKINFPEMQIVSSIFGEEIINIIEYCKIRKEKLHMKKEESNGKILSYYEEETTRINSKDLEEGESNISIPTSIKFKNSLNEINDLSSVLKETDNNSISFPEVSPIPLKLSPIMCDDSKFISKFDIEEYSKIQLTETQNLTNTNEDYEQSQKESHHSQEFSNSDLPYMPFFRTPSVVYEDHLFKYDPKKDKIIKFYIVLIDNEMYYFKKSSKQKLKGMHLLRDHYSFSQDFLKNLNKKVVSGKEYYEFSLNIKNRERCFFTQSEEKRNEWIQIFKNVLNFKNADKKYKLVDTLHRGKESYVIKAFDLDTGSPVCLKIFPKSVIKKNCGSYERMINEKEILKMCENKNICKFYDFFEDFKFFYLVTEFLAGGDLVQFIYSNKSNILQNYIPKFVKQICEGIAYLHSLGIMHRDIKPENFCLTADKNIKLIDFGFSTFIGEYETRKEPYCTVQYAPPEILLAKSYGKSADIWSLGTTIYAMFFYKTPFSTDDGKVDLQKLLAMDIKFSKNKIKISEFQNLVENLILGCMKVMPSLRMTIKEILGHGFFRY